MGSGHMHTQGAGCLAISAAGMGGEPGARGAEPCRNWSEKTKWDECVFRFRSHQYKDPRITGEAHPLASSTELSPWHFLTLPLSTGTKSCCLLGTEPGDTHCLTYFSMFRNTTTLKVAIIYNCHLMLQMRSPRLGEVPGGRDDKRQDQDSNPSL